MVKRTHDGESDVRKGHPDQRKTLCYASSPPSKPCTVTLGQEDRIEETIVGRQYGYHADGRPKTRDTCVRVLNLAPGLEPVLETLFSVVPRRKN